jgi:hypothetical protein
MFALKVLYKKYIGIFIKCLLLRLILLKAVGILKLNSDWLMYVESR